MVVVEGVGVGVVEAVIHSRVGPARWGRRGRVARRVLVMRAPGGMVSGIRAGGGGRGGRPVTGWSGLLFPW